MRVLEARASSRVASGAARCREAAAELETHDTTGWLRGSLLDRRQPPPARDAVVHVLRVQLLERAPAQAEVLHRPRQVARRRRERQHLAHHLELLAALPVDVDAAGLHLADDLAV